MARRKAKRYEHKCPFLATAVRDGELVLRIRQATDTGYIECRSGGVFDIAYPTSLLRRSRVKDDGMIASSLMHGEVSQCLFQEIEL